MEAKHALDVGLEITQMTIFFRLKNAFEQRVLQSEIPLACQHFLDAHFRWPACDRDRDWRRLSRPIRPHHFESHYSHGGPLTKPICRTVVPRSYLGKCEWQ